MTEFKGAKEEKALQYAKEVWGVYFDDVHPDCAITNTMGEISQKDFLAGYNQAIKDSKSPEMLEMLDKARVELSRIRRSMMAHPDCIAGSEFDDYTTSAQECEDEIEQLIKEATEIK